MAAAVVGAGTPEGAGKDHAAAGTRASSRARARVQETGRRSGARGSIATGTCSYSFAVLQAAGLQSGLTRLNS